ncbi:MAG: Acs, partial [Myxococcaceae bacterium]|nr:Acs [Myxococcaceae bacterium]
MVSAVNPDLKADEVRYYLDYTRAKILVCDASTLPALAEVRAQCAHLQHVLVVGGGSGGELDYDAELQRATPDPTFADTHKDDTAVWLYTSG